MATAIIALLDSEWLRYPVYNIAAGKLTTISELIEMFRHAIPSLRFEEVGDRGQADLNQDPRLHRGRFGTYDISRLRQDAGWAPRPMQDAVGDYVAWLRG